MNSRVKGQGGFVPLSYLIAAGTLTALLISAWALAGRTSTRSINSDAAANQLSTQARLILQKVTRCALDYPSGDNGTTYHLSYPGATTLTAVSALTCPGAPSGLNNLWSGMDGIYPPQPPSGFQGWQYVNDGTSVRLSIQTTNIAGYQVVMNKLLSKFGTEASLSGSTFTLVITQ